MGGARGAPGGLAAACSTFVPAEWLQQDPHHPHGQHRPPDGTRAAHAPGDACLLLDDGWAYRLVLASLSPDQVTGAYHRAVPTGHRTPPPSVCTKPYSPSARWTGCCKGHQSLVWRPLPHRHGTEHPRPQGHRRSRQAGALAPHRAGGRRAIGARACRPLHPEPLATACARAARDGALALLATTDASAQPLREVLTTPEARARQAIHLFIGPEGGFSAAELATARRAGVVPISLGPRVLRTETAGVVAVAAILYARGELG